MVKVTDGQNFTLALPAAGQAAFRGQTLDGARPLEVVVEGGKARKTSCKDLMKDSP